MLYGIKIKIYFKIYKCIKTDWIWRYNLYPRSFSSSEKKAWICFFLQKINILIFLLSVITLYPNWPKNIISTIKNVLVSIKPKFSDKFFDFYAKMRISLFSEKFKLFLILQKNWNSVSLYLKKLPIL